MYIASLCVHYPTLAVARYLEGFTDEQLDRNFRNVVILSVIMYPLAAFFGFYTQLPLCRKNTLYSMKFLCAYMMLYNCLYMAITHVPFINVYHAYVAGVVPVCYFSQLLWRHYVIILDYENLEWNWKELNRITIFFLATACLMRPYADAINYVGHFYTFLVTVELSLMSNAKQLWVHDMVHDYENPDKIAWVLIKYSEACPWFA